MNSNFMTNGLVVVIVILMAALISVVSLGSNGDKVSVGTSASLAGGTSEVASDNEVTQQNVSVNADQVRQEATVVD